MTTTSVIAPTAPSAPSPIKMDPTDTETAAADLASDFDTFLQLLTTQLKNQDPSKPFDSTEFVGQLASFSAVEQQIATNSKLDALVAAINGSAAANLAPWIGREVLSAAPADFNGSAVPVQYDLPKDATSASLLVYDQAGTLVNRISLSPGSSSVTWDGLALDGSQMPNGTYKFEIESFKETENLGLSPALTFSNVIEARLTDGTPEVVFADGSKLAVDQITAVRGQS